jgi:hypothetical protein
MPEHEVRQGECLSSIGKSYGLFWQTLWDHPNNARLKALRKDPNVLLPGDVLYIPERREKELAKASDARHRFRVKGTPAKFRLRLLRKGQARANLPYVLEVDGQFFRGRTDDGGNLEHWIPPGATSGRLLLNDGREVIPLQLGHLDPVEEISGIQQRLKNLGLYGGPVDGQINAQTRTAISLFQSNQGLESTGEPDSTTRDALKSNHRG